jgi:GNAT superfamily N-acetyltransferase
VSPERAGAALHASTLHVPGMRMFVGLVDGRGVTGATSIVGHGVNHVEWVATLESARGKGYGAAITWAATLADATVPAMLIASDMGRPVYERMGYVALDRWTFLVGDRRPPPA